MLDILSETVVSIHEAAGLFPGRYPGHAGAHDDGRHGAATHDHAAAGADRRTAAGSGDLRVGSVDAVACFM